MSDSLISVKYLLEKSRTSPYFDTERQHSCYELVYCTQGEGLFCINGVSVNFKAGSFAIFPPSFTISESGSHSVCYYIGFEYNSISDDLSYGIFDDNNGEFLGLIKNMQTEVQNHFEHSEDCLCAYLKVLIFMIKRKWRKSLNPHSQQTATILLDIVNFFEQNYNRPINVTEYFESIGYSYHHLRHTFKEAYGMTPNQYLMKLRIDMAQKLLLSTQKSIEEIQKECGFNSPAHFAANFKRKTNKTPAEFREERG